MAGVDEHVVLRFPAVFPFNEDNSYRLSTPLLHHFALNEKDVLQQEVIGRSLQESPEISSAVVEKHGFVVNVGGSNRPRCAASREGSDDAQNSR